MGLRRSRVVHTVGENDDTRELVPEIYIFSRVEHRTLRSHLVVGRHLAD